MRKLSIYLALVVATLYLFQSPANAAQPGGPGLLQAPIITQTLERVGVANVWNTRTELHVELYSADPWQFKNIHIYVGNDPVPATLKGILIPGQFSYVQEYLYGQTFELVLDLSDHLGFRWGIPYKDKRLQNMAIHLDITKIGSKIEEGAWAYTGMGSSMEEEVVDLALYSDFPGVGTGWSFSYLLTHPMRGHFHDAPVSGLGFVTPSNVGITDQSGGFDYFPEEKVAFFLGSYHLGTTTADHRVSPLDLFEADIDDPRVINLARLLQSLDSEYPTRSGIQITPVIIGHFEWAMDYLGLTSLNFEDSDEIDEIIQLVASRYPLLIVSAEDARIHLEEQLNNSMFRKNVSRTPEMLTAKSKLDVMPVLVPATKANGEAVVSKVTGGNGVDYYDENGDYLYTRDKVRPLVAVYADQIPETGAMDVFGAVSRDDGHTFKRMNLSRGADRSSFTLANGLPFYGDVKKPNLSIKGNYILAVWQSKFCNGGRPRYSIQVCPDTNGDLVADPCVVCRGTGDNEHCDWDDPSDDIYYVDDIWGVGGPQRSHDYTEEGFPEVGELPYYCLWTARGVIDPDTGDIKWRKPERLTSGRRDVWQVMVNGAKGVGFGVVWQEDPEGVRPGEAAGPGHGWSGATTNHKTDIWYSYIKWSDFATIDEDFTPNGDPFHSFDDPEWTSNRPMWEVPFSLPMRISDNDVVNTDNLKVELDPATGLPPMVGGEYVFTPVNDPDDEEWDGKHAGTHRYGYLIDDNVDGIPDLCAGFYTFENQQEVTKNVCITQDGRLLDGDTGASRPNVMFMPYTKKDGTQSAWVAIVYEETKGVGLGRPEWDDDPETTHEEEKDAPDLGKNIIYHSFEFGSPVKVSGGDIVNLPELDPVTGDLVYLTKTNDETGAEELVLDYLERPQLAYENARRPRLLVQPAGQAGSSNTVMVMLYKQGEQGKGRPSDIFMRRVVNPKDGENPYAFKNFVCNFWETADNGQGVCIDGAQNLSSVTPLEFWYNPNQDDQAKGEGIKVVKYEQYESNLADASSTNPYEDARAHRGILRGDHIFMAYDYTPNWAASRNAHDKYDVFIRRSFDGGATWTTDPSPVRPEGVDADFDNSVVCHTRLWKDYTTVISEADSNQKETYEEIVCFGPGEFEPARNMSQMKNNKLSVIEPRLVGPPGPIPGSAYPEDVQNTDVFWVTFGTATNVPKPHGNQDDEEEEETAVPADLFYTFTRDRGQTFFQRTWIVNPDSEGNYAGEEVTRTDWLAKGDSEQGEAQIRMTPDGSRFYAVWNQEGIDGSDTWFRRIMSSEFPQNVAPAP